MYNGTCDKRLPCFKHPLVWVPNVNSVCIYTAIQRPPLEILEPIGGPLRRVSLYVQRVGVLVQMFLQTERVKHV